jgi:hypothetical protein
MVTHFLNIETAIAETKKKTILIQEFALEIRKELFYDPIKGFNHNMGGVRTRASLKDATNKVNAITDGFITFHFVSHRRLWFEIEGIDKRYTLHSANEYDFNTKESAATNPYNKIAVAIKKALKERDEMERTYQHLIAAELWSRTFLNWVHCPLI